MIDTLNYLLKKHGRINPRLLRQEIATRDAYQFLFDIFIEYKKLKYKVTLYKIISIISFLYIIFN